MQHRQKRHLQYAGTNPALPTCCNCISHCNTLPTIHKNQLPYASRALSPYGECGDQSVPTTQRWRVQSPPNTRAIGSMHACTCCHKLYSTNWADAETKIMLNLRTCLLRFLRAGAGDASANKCRKIAVLFVLYSVALRCLGADGNPHGLFTRYQLLLLRLVASVVVRMTLTHDL